MRISAISCGASFVDWVTRNAYVKSRMFGEKPETVQKALEVLAKAGGSMTTENFARAMWPSTHPGWARVRKKSKGGEPGAMMRTGAGCMLGRLRAREWLVTKTGPQMWALTAAGWEKFRAGVASPPVSLTPPKPVSDASKPAYGWTNGQWYPVHDVAPTGYPGWVRVTWASGAQTYLPEAGVRRVGQGEHAAIGR
jgi:hypothetical protein